MIDWLEGRISKKVRIYKPITILVLSKMAALVQSDAAFLRLMGDASRMAMKKLTVMNVVVQDRHLMSHYFVLGGHHGGKKMYYSLMCEFSRCQTAKDVFSTVSDFHQMYEGKRKPHDVSKLSE